MAKKPNVSFLKSAVLPEHYPEADRPEIVIAGRSNAGKSTFINGVFGKSIARVSSQPGKTTELNFFDVGEAYRFVDVPGYGYAKRSAKQVQLWQRMIENYLSTRAVMKGVVLVMDIRRDWSEQEGQFIQWLQNIGAPAAIVLTKADKLSRSQRMKRQQTISRQSGQKLLFCTSMNEPKTYEDVEDFVFKNWVQPSVEL